MNILFLSLGRYSSVQEKGIYTDLLREFIRNGHIVTILSAEESRVDNEILIEEESCTIVRVFTGKIQKTNIIEKGINTLLIENRFKKAIKKYCDKISYDLILYPTPPITLVNTVAYVKKRDGAKAYLLLKDIFPQNAVDLGMMSKTGLRSILYKFFREKEKKLYEISDFIGCMSQANVDYVLKHNPSINSLKVEICPNCIEPINKSVNGITRNNIRKKYNIPLDKKVFVYGGNLGKPQGVDFLIECLRNCSDMNQVFFLIVGDGTEFNKLEKFINEERPKNAKLMKRLPKEDYDTMVGACDVGMIFLDYRFTIPNFPSRLLAYMQARLPVLICSDSNTDIGKIVEQAGFGNCCDSNDLFSFINCLEKQINSKNDSYAEWNYLLENYSVKKGYNIIIKHFR